MAKKKVAAEQVIACLQQYNGNRQRWPTKYLAVIFGISPARISQIRVEYGVKRHQVAFQERPVVSRKRVSV